MKTKLVFILFSSLISVAAYVYASHPWLGKTLSAAEVQQRWGNETFDAERFKSGSRQVRAKMAYSLITSKKLRGMTATEIRRSLGDFDGHYFSESYPTYLIQVAQQKGQESWQIVFLIDKNRKTKEVIVHKNCCD